MHYINTICRKYKAQLLCSHRYTELPQQLPVSIQFEHPVTYWLHLPLNSFSSTWPFCICRRALLHPAQPPACPQPRARIPCPWPPKPDPIGSAPSAGILHPRSGLSRGFQSLTMKSFWGVPAEGCWQWILKQGLFPLQRPLLKYKVQTMKMKSNKKERSGLWMLLRVKH